ncbi:MAG: peptide-methionine (S)-S-oxide reductase MsrA [Betaproteobacteria bacterium]|jgi:peptide-methionine (S)-S-oxide reductase|nr:peptide-methionine (S)-S-oxide reductase [Betaproteobacteria bacterium]NBT67123.1 peptide-methionine (S)-S-oxide reductase [Betaproteobacteria bacterium]NBY08753.1 peptide-methionine (S)-S-oxide reductase [Betaproteobacteria bacterium]
MNNSKITLGGGCFWCLEAVFKQVKGVIDVTSGYCNGHVINPSYEQVCDGNTGHVEVVELVYSPQIIHLQDLLLIFFTIHDPTTLNRQGNDVGTQYRSGIYAHDAQDLMVIKEVIRDLVAQKIYKNPWVTEVVMRDNYTDAEDYHQDYFEHNPNQGYCSFVVAPKVQKFKKYLGQWWKD